MPTGEHQHVIMTALFGFGFAITSKIDELIIDWKAKNYLSTIGMPGEKVNATSRMISGGVVLAAFFANVLIFLASSLLSPFLFSDIAQKIIVILNTVLCIGLFYQIVWFVLRYELNDIVEVILWRKLTIAKILRREIIIFNLYIVLLVLLAHYLETNRPFVGDLRLPIPASTGTGQADAG